MAVAADGVEGVADLEELLGRRGERVDHRLGQAGRAPVARPDLAGRRVDDLDRGVLVGGREVVDGRVVAEPVEAVGPPAEDQALAARFGRDRRLDAEQGRDRHGRDPDRVGEVARVRDGRAPRHGKGGVGQGVVDVLRPAEHRDRHDPRARRAGPDAPRQRRLAADGADDPKLARVAVGELHQLEQPGALEPDVGAVGRRVEEVDRPALREQGDVIAARLLVVVAVEQDAVRRPSRR